MGQHNVNWPCRKSSGGVFCKVWRASPIVQNQESFHRGGFLHCVCTACTRRLKIHTLLIGAGTCLVWHICALESRFQTEKLPNMASLYLTWRHPVPGWVACTQCGKPLIDGCCVVGQCGRRCYAPLSRASLACPSRQEASPVCKDAPTASPSRLEGAECPRTAFPHRSPQS